MILLLVFVGFFAGALAAFTALIGGGGLVAGLLAYSIFSVGAVVAVALLIGLRPMLRPAPVAARAQPHPAISPSRG